MPSSARRSGLVDDLAPRAASLTTSTVQAPIIPVTISPSDTSNFERYPNSPLDTLPGVLRAHRARQYGMSPDSLERGPDPYGYLFPAFCESRGVLRL